MLEYMASWIKKIKLWLCEDFLVWEWQRSNAFFTPMEINGACIPHSQSIWGCNRGYHIWQNYFESCYTTYNIIWTLGNSFLKIRNAVQYLTLALLKGTDKLQRPKKLRAIFAWNFPALYYSQFPGFVILTALFPQALFPGWVGGAHLWKGTKSVRKESIWDNNNRGTLRTQKHYKIWYKLRTFIINRNTIFKLCRTFISEGFTCYSPDPVFVFLTPPVSLIRFDRISGVKRMHTL